MLVPEDEPSEDEIVEDGFVEFSVLAAEGRIFVEIGLADEDKPESDDTLVKGAVLLEPRLIEGDGMIDRLVDDDELVGADDEVLIDENRLLEADGLFPRELMLAD